MKTVVHVNSLKIPFSFQLVSRQVDIPCDGILGRDFLENTSRRKLARLSPIGAGSQT